MGEAPPCSLFVDEMRKDAHTEAIAKSGRMTRRTSAGERIGRSHLAERITQEEAKDIISVLQQFVGYSTDF